MLATGTQRDNYLDDLMRTDALLEHAVRHGMTEEAERLRAKMRQLSELGDSSSVSKSAGCGEN